jgi:hypothetical protein
MHQVHLLLCMATFIPQSITSHATSYLHGVCRPHYALKHFHHRVLRMPSKRFDSTFLAAVPSPFVPQSTPLLACLLHQDMPTCTTHLPPPGAPLRRGSQGQSRCGCQPVCESFGSANALVSCSLPCDVPSSPHVVCTRQVRYVCWTKSSTKENSITLRCCAATAHVQRIKQV